MQSQFNKIRTLAILNPCTNNWDTMKGGDEIRFCNHCNKNVYNFSAMTNREIENLLTKSKGNVCARMNRTLDGTIQTKDITSNPVHSKKPTARVISAILTSIIGLT